MVPRPWTQFRTEILSCFGLSVVLDKNSYPPQQSIHTVNGFELFGLQLPILSEKSTELVVVVVVVVAARRGR